MKHDSGMVLRTAAVVVVAALSGAPAQQSFEEWLRQDQEAFRQYKAEVTRQYQEFLEKDRKAFTEFVKQAGAKWGRDNVWVPEPKVWVQYTDQYEDRSAVDFEQGVARVQVLIEGDERVSAEDLSRALAVEVERVVLSGTVDPIERIQRDLFGEKTVPKEPRSGRRTLADIESFGSYRVVPGDTWWGLSRRFDVVLPDLLKLNRAAAGVPLESGRRILVPHLEEGRPALPRPSPAPLLDRQVRLSDGRPVTPETASQFAREVVAAQRPTVTGVRRDDGTRASAATVEFRLAPDHIRVRAEKYLPLVSEHAARNQVDPALVFALIHTESSFNPRARSAAPAFGLMQLVPHSGARDAYLAVYGEDRLVSGTYLYDPKNNIELGTALVRVIGTRYLKAIEHPRSRLYCTIAAYNTGAGNVCRAFGDTTSVSRVAPVVNRMTPEEVYERLKTRLPYDETRQYVVRVTERMSLYR